MEDSPRFLASIAGRCTENGAKTSSEGDSGAVMEDAMQHSVGFGAQKPGAGTEILRHDGHRSRTTDPQGRLMAACPDGVMSAQSAHTSFDHV